jgi:hypothetical protein
MVWIEKQNIKVGIRGQLSTAIAAQRNQRALRCFIGRAIKVGKIAA